MLSYHMYFLNGFDVTSKNEVMGGRMIPGIIKFIMSVKGFLKIEKKPSVAKHSYKDASYSASRHAKPKYEVQTNLIDLRCAIYFPSTSHLVSKSYNMDQNAFPSFHYLKILENAPNSYLILDSDLHILTATDLFLEATKTSREYIRGKHIFEAFPDNADLPGVNGVNKINASIQQVISTKKRHKMEVQRYDVPDIDNPGKFITRYWEPEHSPVLDEFGDIQYIIQHAQDITDKVKRLEELAKSRHLELTSLNKIEQLNFELDILRISDLNRDRNEKQFRQIADLVPSMISHGIPTGEAIYFNKQWVEYTGMSFENLRDIGYYSVIHADDLSSFIKGLEQAVSSGIRYESEIRVKNKEGEYRWHLAIMSPMLSDDGEIARWVGSTTDIQRLKEEEQRKNDFISMVSHELKTPLTSMKSYLHLAQLKIESEAKELGINMLKKARYQIDKMSSLINGFLNVSHLESSQIQIDHKKFDLADLVRESEEDTRANIRSHNIIFAPVEPTIVNADRDKLGQVVTNLISNAVKYSPVGSTINVACVTTNGKAVFSVRDQGLGIRPGDLPKIFNRFYRVSEPAHQNIPGFGIGLYLCHEIIRRHQGKIWVESEVGIGSAFYFTLPVLT